MHGLLLAAAASVGLPWPTKVLAVLVTLGHAVVRRPRPVAAPIVVAADGSCCVPAFGQGSLVLGPGTRLTTAWIRLDLRAPGARLDIVLLADQFEPQDWSRLSARLRRAVAPQPGAGRGGSRADRLDLR